MYIEIGWRNSVIYLPVCKPISTILWPYPRIHLPWVIILDNFQANYHAAQKELTILFIWNLWPYGSWIGKKSNWNGMLERRKREQIITQRRKSQPPMLTVSVMFIAHMVDGLIILWWSPTPLGFVISLVLFGQKRSNTVRLSFFVAYRTLLQLNDCRVTDSNLMSHSVLFLSCRDLHFCQPNMLNYSVIIDWIYPEPVCNAVSLISNLQYWSVKERSTVSVRSMGY